jgi:hypothetical protein
MERSLCLLTPANEMALVFDGPQNENFDLLVRIKLENLFFMYFEI